MPSRKGQRLPSGYQPTEKHEQNSDTDRTVSQVKIRPPSNRYEIDDESKSHTVKEISKRTTENEPEGNHMEH